MSIDTTKRFDRIIAIFIQLQSKRIVKAKEISERFQVSLRTVYRDIKTLESCGVPIASEAGVGYSILDGYRLPPIMFSREEAGSFVAAEKLMQQFSDKSLGAYYESAMFKIKSVLRGKDKDWIASIESKITVNPAHQLFNHKIPDALEILFESIAEKKQVFMEYQSLQSPESKERYIEPVGVFHENNFWYVLGYCHLRKDYRQFRTNRILFIKRSDLHFTLKHHSVDEIRNKKQETEKIKVRVLIDKNVVKHIEDDKKHYGFISQKDLGELVELSFLTEDIEHSFPRWFLMFGEYAQIIEPQELKKNVKKLIKRIEKQMEK